MSIDFSSKPSTWISPDTDASATNPLHTFIAAPFMLGAASALARVPGVPEWPATAHHLLTEEFQIPASDPGVRLYLRNKRSPSATPSPDRSILFVHGLTYAASAVFDLPLQGTSWMDFIAARGFDVWSVDIRGFGRSSRPMDFSLPAAGNPPYLDAG